MSNRLTPLENASVGTVGGVLEVLALQPFNYAKNARQQGIPLTVNPRKLYRGVLPNMMNMGSCTMWQFVVCGAVARAMSGGADRKATPIEGVVSGLAAGVSSALLGGPLELLMIQQQVKGGALPGHLRNLAGPSLARGIVPAAAREGIWAFSFLSLPPIIRDQLTTRWPGAFSSADRARTGAALIGAGLSCLASQPFDTVKTNMQGDVERRRFTSMLQTFRALHASGGLSSFYRGVEWRYGRMVIAIWILDKVRVDLGRIMYPAKYDQWRDGPLRYLGYANELGESFRPLLPRFVGPSYAVAFAYVAADTWDKGTKAYRSASVERRPAAAMGAVVDTWVWQTLASVVIPGFTINRLVKFSKPLIARAALPAVATTWGPTALGLAAIPVIIHPIDSLVHTVMDATLRPWMDDLIGISEGGD